MCFIAEGTQNVRMLIDVVLPAPLCPRSDKICPSKMSRFVPLTASTADAVPSVPNTFRRPRIDMPYG